MVLPPLSLLSCDDAMWMCACVLVEIDIVVFSLMCVCVFTCVFDCSVFCLQTLVLNDACAAATAEVSGKSEEIIAVLSKSRS